MKTIEKTMIWYLRGLSVLLGSFTMAGAIILAVEAQNPYWLLLLLLNILWCLLFLSAETWKKEREQGVRVK